MSRTNRQSTVLSDLGRSIRNEPFYLVYDHKIWVEKGEVPKTCMSIWSPTLPKVGSAAFCLTL